LTGDSPSFIENEKSDVLDKKTLTAWGRANLAHVPQSQNAYIEAKKSPKSWFDGVQSVVDRVLITAGSAECLRDDIADFAKEFRQHHSDAKFFIQENGVHNDPFFDFFMYLKENKPREETPLIVEWLAAGFDKN